MLQIFSYLSFDDRMLDACLVCKKWNNICYDRTFWKDIDFEDRWLVFLILYFGNSLVNLLNLYKSRIYKHIKNVEFNYLFA